MAQKRFSRRRETYTQFSQRPRPHTAAACIHIIGATATGKSHVRRWLVAALDIPAYSIDDERAERLRGRDWLEYPEELAAWCAIEDKINAAALSILETSGSNANADLLLSPRPTYTILCHAAEITRRHRLRQRVLHGSQLPTGVGHAEMLLGMVSTADIERYVGRLIKIGRPKGVPYDFPWDGDAAATEPMATALLADINRWLLKQKTIS